MLYSSDKSKTLVCFAHDIFNVISPGQIFTQCYTQVLERATILHKIGAKFVPPAPQIKDGKMVRFGFCAASSLIWGEWGFALSFYSVHDSLRASIGVSHSVMYSNHDKKSAPKLFKAKCFQSKPGHLSVNSYKTEELRLFDLYKINTKFTYHKPV